MAGVSGIAGTRPPEWGYLLNTHNREACQNRILRRRRILNKQLMRSQFIRLEVDLPPPEARSSCIQKTLHFPTSFLALRAICIPLREVACVPSIPGFCPGVTRNRAMIKYIIPPIPQGSHTTEYDRCIQHEFPRRGHEFSRREVHTVAGYCSVVIRGHSFPVRGHSCKKNLQHDRPQWEPRGHGLTRKLQT